MLSAGVAVAMSVGLVVSLPDGRNDLLIGADVDGGAMAGGPPEPVPPSFKPLVAGSPAVPPPPVTETLTITFGGDVHAVGGAGEALAAGLPTLGTALSDADLTMVNLETAITERGTAVSKQYAYRAPASMLRVLKNAGVDVVTVANNHGMDYGVQGLRDTVAAAEDVGLAAVGIGLDEERAYAPHIATVRGQRIAVLAATQVLDASVLTAWTAGPDKPGLASAKREKRLVAEVERARADADVVVVYLHWGRELEPCPLPRQVSLATALVKAGADVVVGSHAHVMLGSGYLGDAYVDYGLGNFIFNTKGGEGARSGLLTLTLQGGSVTDSQWTPAFIRNGTPYLLQGAAAEAERAEKERRRGCTELSAQP